MVVEMIREQRADTLLHALADSTRRDILRRATTGDQSVSALARGYPMSFAAVQKHVAILERAGLVTKRRHGREQRVLTSIEAVRQAGGVLDRLEAVWRARVGQMDDILKERVSDPDATP